MPRFSSPVLLVTLLFAAVSASSPIATLRSAWFGDQSDVVAVATDAPTFNGNTVDQGFLANWMGELADLVGGQSMLGLALPMTHDTLTYDLDIIPSRGAWDDHPIISYILHTFSWATPGRWIREEAKTQGLTVSEQLDNGIRYLDLRFMLDGANANDWRSLHFVQSNGKAQDYLQEIRQWMDAHPTEVVLMTISRHGGVCETGDEAYPGVTKAQREDFWAVVKGVFDGILFDSSMSQLNETTISQLVSRNHRAIVGMGDYQAFTNGDTFAIDGCALKYTGLPSLLRTNGLSGHYLTEMNEVKEALASGWEKAVDGRTRGQLHNIRTTGGPPEDEQMLLAFMVKYLPLQGGTEKKCAAMYQIEGMSKWCPPGLLDNSQIWAYYLQVVLEDAYKNDVILPSVMINVLDDGGTIRTGEVTLPAPTDEDYEEKKKLGDTRYAFVDTLLASNVKRICKSGEAVDASKCDSALAMLEERREANPLKLWDHPEKGRISSIPGFTDL